MKPRAASKQNTKSRAPLGVGFLSGNPSDCLYLLRAAAPIAKKRNDNYI
jgi:hypothetical protein